MVTGFTNIGGELTTQAELVRNGAEPLADDEQQRACDTVSQARAPAPFLDRCTLHVL